MEEIDLERIKEKLEELLGRLELLRRDTQRERKGIRLLSTIDYDSIHTYIHKGEYQYGIIRSILERPDQKFILLPGAIIELLNDIGFTAKGFQSWIKELQFGEIEELYEIKKFIENFGREDDPNKIILLYENMLKKFPLIKFLQGRFLIEPGLRRLRYLIEIGVLVSSDDMGIDLNELSINKNIYNSVLSDLNKLRSAPNRILPNRIDAQNFALTYALNEKYKNEKYFTVLTHSSIPMRVYKNIDWENDPLKKKYPDEKFPIFRRPIEFWSNLKIKEMYPDISERERYLERGIELATRNIGLLPFIPEYTGTVEPIARIDRFDLQSFRDFEKYYFAQLELPQQKTRKFETPKEEIMERIYELVNEIRSKESILSTLEDSYKSILNEIKELLEIIRKFKSLYIFDRDMEHEFSEIENLLKETGVIKEKYRIREKRVELDLSRAIKGLPEEYKGRFVGMKVRNYEIIDSDSEERELARRLYDKRRKGELDKDLEVAILQVER